MLWGKLKNPETGLCFNSWRHFRFIFTWKDTCYVSDQKCVMEWKQILRWSSSPGSCYQSFRDKSSSTSLQKSGCLCSCQVLCSAVTGSSTSLFALICFMRPSGDGLTVISCVRCLHSVSKHTPVVYAVSAFMSDCLCLCWSRRCTCSHLPLVQPLDRCVGSVGMTGLYSVIRADAQHGAGLSTRAVGHHNHTRPLAVRDTTQVFLRELKVHNYSH